VAAGALGGQHRADQAEGRELAVRGSAVRELAADEEVVAMGWRPR